mmetsp:Transcript_36059/g.56293  ORF Transcript_36059/g.56293 Transcript_36059/m.56293 type:complete len:136 (-) Transcript_36059:888-1295(-)
MAPQALCRPDWYRGQVMFLDGGLATELERQGADLSGHLWSARLLKENPELIRKTHDSYFQAGADIAISASYQATVEGFQKTGVTAEQSEQLLRFAAIHAWQNAVLNRIRLLRRTNIQSGQASDWRKRAEIDRGRS